MQKELKPYFSLKGEPQREWTMAHAKPLTDAEIEWGIE